MPAVRMTTRNSSGFPPLNPGFAAGTYTSREWWGCGTPCSPLLSSPSVRAGGMRVLLAVSIPYPHVSGDPRGYLH